MLVYTLYGLFILSCVVLIVVVLLQPGKSGAGDLFSSNVSSTAFGPRGTQTLLAKITIGAAGVFMLAAMALSLHIVTGTGSVLQSENGEPAAPVATPVTAATPQPAATVAAPSPAPTSTVITPSPQPTKK